MKWEVELADEFDSEFDALNEEVQDELLAQAKLLEQFGPSLGRPRVDTLNGSKHRNMKELRFDADGGVWRVAFAFDPLRRAIILVAGDKSGAGQQRFYRRLIERAGSTVSGRMPAQMGATCTLHGCSRERAPRVDGERAVPAQAGDDYGT